MAKKSKEPYVSDNPVQEIRYFEVGLPGKDGLFKCKRTSTTRRLHHMGCTDDLPDDHKETWIKYEITKEVTRDEFQAVSDIVENEVEKEEEEDDKKESK